MAKQIKKLIAPKGVLAETNGDNGPKKPHPVDKVVGVNVKRLRLQCGMSQEQLGLQTGITFQQVQKYEKGSNRVSASRLDEFAQIFGVDHNAFFTGVAEVRHATAETVDRLTLSPRAYKLGMLFDSISNKKKQQAIYSLITEMAGDESEEAIDN